MKTKIFIIPLLASLLVIAYGCNPIEDESLRDKYYNNAGNPVSKSELEAAITVSQPFPNQDGVVAGDQYVVIKNSRPEIAGAWHIETNGGTKILNTDNDTIIYTANGIYSIYYVAVSAFQTVQTDPISITVTNCFDEWDTYFTGAVDKSDKTAKKTWEFWPSPNNGVVYYNGPYTDCWNDAARIHEAQNSWDGGGTNLADAGNYTMEFDFDESKLIVYNPDGSVLSQGKFSYTHDSPDGFVIGTLTTSILIPGSETSWEIDGTPVTFWIISIDDSHLVVAYSAPGWEVGPNDDDVYDVDAWYGFYQVKQ